MKLQETTCHTNVNLQHRIVSRRTLVSLQRPVHTVYPDFY